jgi:nucleotide-binding universal stress UspA family protein
MNILLAVDGSGPSEVAARELASRPWPPATSVRVLYVVPTPMLAASAYAPPPAIGMAQPSPTWPATVIDTEKEISEHGVAKAKEVVEQLKAMGLRTDVKQRHGDARSEILDEATEWPADLIVMGSHGYTGLKRWLLGSVAQAVVSHAPCSVEVVRDKTGQARPRS